MSCLVYCEATRGGGSGYCPVMCFCGFDHFTGAKGTMCIRQGLRDVPEDIPPDTNDLDLVQNHLEVLTKDTFKVSS